MNSCTCVLIILIFTFFKNVCSEDIFETTVEYYENWLNRRIQEILEYVVPTDARMHEATDTTVRDFGKFDYIVVGAGSTGCVVASRLSEIPGSKVLLLEAGTYRDEEYTRVPGWFTLNMISKFNWYYRSTPQQYSFLGSEGTSSAIPRGKGVGGSSLINGMIYCRGFTFDCEKWSELLQDPGWNYENVLPYYIKSETFTRTNPYVPIDEAYHGYEGPLRKTQHVPPLNLSQVILKGIGQLGYNITDYNGREKLGGSILQYYTEDGLRFDPEMAFLSPIKYRKNLRVLDSSYVTKIEFYKQSKKVKGVIFTSNNKTYIARSKKEVILSAGAIASPQILMLSGIGPRDHLQSLGIPVIQDLPVGKNVKEHTVIFLTLSSNVTFPQESLETSIKKLLIGRGPLVAPFLSDAVGFFKTSVERIENYPDIEYMFIDITEMTGAFREDVGNSLISNVANPIGVQMILLHQNSVGTVKLKSASPFDYPLIDPNLLSDKDNNDLETLYQGVQILYKLLQTEAMRSLNASLIVPPMPGCTHTELGSREFWYCYFRTVTVLGNHATASCLAGTNQKTAVVDKELRVFGVSGLRVADASVIPNDVTGHTNAVCTMIGEKVSDLIKKSVK